MGTYFDYATRGRNDWWRYLLSPVVACLLASVILIVLGVALMLMHLLPAGILMQLQQPKFVMPFFLGVAANFAALTVSFVLAVMLIHRKRPRDLTGHWRWDLFAWGLGVWTMVQFFLFLIDLVIAPKGFVLSANRGSASLAGVALIAILVQTFGEEIIFRGYLTQGLLLALKRPLPAATASGLLFGSVHLANGMPQALNATIFGIVCALIAIRTGGIALTWGLHIANNYFGAVIVVSGSDVFKGSPGIVIQSTSGLIWWDLLVGVVALVIVLWPIFRRPYFSATPAP